MLTDADIAQLMDWRGPGVYTESQMRRVKRVIAEALILERAQSPKINEKMEHALKVIYTWAGNNGLNHEHVRALAGKALGK